MGLFATVGKAISSSFAGAAKPTTSARPNGSDGVLAYGGFLQTDERRPELTGSQKWVTFGNATNTAIVATGLRRTLDMLAGTEWHAEENEAGGKDAARGVDIVTKGLLKAQLPKPWPTVVRKAALYRYYGHSLHEWSAARSDAAKQIVFTDISHRPQSTIDRWDKPDERLPWQAVSQLTSAGNRYVIPRGRLLYCVDDTLTDSPDGRGLLRHVIELVRRLGVLEGLEGLGYETDLRGMPIGRAPLAELRALAGGPGITTGQVDAFIAQRTQVLRNALVGIVKSPDRLQHLMLDSSVYTGADQNTFAQMQKWGLELLRGDPNGMAEVAAAIGRLQLEIARVLGIEFALVGGNDSAGSHGMHSDKTRWFAQNLQTIVTEIASFATNDLARTLIGLNGLDPETATPTLVAEPINIESVLETAQILSELAKAGLQHDDEAITVVRKRAKLPPAPEPDPMLMGMLQLGRPMAGQGMPGEPKILGAPPKARDGDGDGQVGELGPKASGNTKEKPKAKPAKEKA